MSIEELDAAAAAAELAALAALMRECVEQGASVNFVLPFGQAESEAWWREAVLPALATGARRLIVARLEGRLLGTVQLALAWQPNQPHRADVTKLLVHPQARRRGLGRALMLRLEELARAAGRTLLMLDTTAGSAADLLYRGLGWVPLGTVPGFSLAPDRRALEGSTFFWKDIAA